MFISYTTGNSFSFRDRATLHMRAKNTCKERLEEATFTFGSGKNRFLKTIAIYGANASGKSNLFKSLEYMLMRIEYNRNPEDNDPIFPEMPFLLGEEADSESPIKPSYHELTFTIEDSVYTYGFEASSDRVHREWLRTISFGSRKETTLFDRNGNDIALSPRLINADEMLIRKTRDDALFLTVCAEFAVPLAERITEYLSSSFTMIATSVPRPLYTAKMLERKENEEEIKRFIRKIDNSIGDIDVDSEDRDTGRIDSMGKPIPRKTYKVRYIPRLANGNLASFSLPWNSMASGGTGKAFSLAGFIFNTLRIGGAIFIDELSAMLHPLLTKAIIELFTSKESNPHNAQLIFNTQDLSLLSQRINDEDKAKTNRLLRRDQIYFVEKNERFESILYSLLSRSPKVRNDASYDRDYMGKKYGALPSIGKIEFPAK